MIDGALVLEGGGLRTLYTSGVIDVFLENNIEFSCVIGVSAGALNAVNYITKQVGRSVKINLLHSYDSKFFGLRQFLTKKSVLNFDYLLKSPIEDLYPFDVKTFEESKQRLIIVATNAKTGETAYFEEKNYDKMLQTLMASSSAPSLSKPVTIGGQQYFDGTVSDPIPLDKAFSEGFKKVVVVRSRENSYKIDKMPSAEKIFVKAVCKKYPKLVSAHLNRPTIYNQSVEKIEKLEAEKKIFVLSPKQAFSLKAFERDARKLFRLYVQGREDAMELLPSMREYLGQ